MSAISPAEVRLFLKDYINRKLEETGRPSYEDLADDCDLLLSGMIDSMGLLELMGELQEFSDSHIDFDIVDPEEMTIVGPLCRFVSQQTEVATNSSPPQIA
jgi:acyl carrier protein